MAVTVLNIVQGNTAPEFDLTLKRAGTVIDLTGTSVEIIIAKGKTITQVGGTCALTADPTTGVITYTPVITDFPTGGKYKADVRITYSGGGVEIVNEQQKFKVRKKIQ